MTDPKGTNPSKSPQTWARLAAATAALGAAFAEFKLALEAWGKR